MVRRFGQPMDDSDEQDLATVDAHYCAECDDWYGATEHECPVCRSVQQRQSAARERRATRLTPGATRVVRSMVERQVQENRRQITRLMTGYEQQMEEESAARRQQEEQQEEEQQEEQQEEEQQEEQEYYQDELAEELQEEQEYQEEPEQEEAQEEQEEQDEQEEGATEVDVQDPAYDGLFHETLAAAEEMTEDEQRRHIENIDFAAAEMSRLQEQFGDEDQTGGLAAVYEDGELVYENGEVVHEDDGALVEENLNKISNPHF